MNFESSIYVNEELSRKLVNISKDLAERSIKACAEHYKFDGEEAIRLLGLNEVKQSRNRVSVKSKKEKVVVVKSAFPLPYNGELNEEKCNALRQNNGLYTQCQNGRKVCSSSGSVGKFCKQCEALSYKGKDGIPEYGTIQLRQAVGIFEYIDPHGRKPVAYTKVMKKYKITKEQVLEEALKQNIRINEEHFVVPESVPKRGRPSSMKAKEAKEAKAKGRPKKAKKVLQVDGEEDDLFASLVADANMNSVKEIVVESAPVAKSPEAKKRGKSEEDKATDEVVANEAKRLAEKAEKEAKRLAEKAEKEAKLLAEKAEKEANKAEKAKERETLAKQKKKADEADNTSTANKQHNDAVAAAAAPVIEDGEEPDVVKKIEIEGKKYLKSKKTSIIYDYQEYVKNGEQVVIGKWNESTNKIDFNTSGDDNDEEEEEDYDA